MASAGAASGVSRAGPAQTVLKTYVECRTVTDGMLMTITIHSLA